MPIYEYRCADCGYLESYARVAACPKCGSDLVGNVAETCPRCGAAVSAGQPAKHPRVCLEDAMQQAAALNGFWRVVRLLLACLPGGSLL